MKRLPLILLILANSVLFFAQSSMSNVYKLKMIEDINNGNFEKAAKEMLRVEDWTYRAYNMDDCLLNINQATRFVHYMDSISVPKFYKDSFQIYLLEDLKFSSYVFFTINVFQKAESYLLQAKEIVKKVLGESHPDYATILGNLGVLYYNMGVYSKAEPYMLQALDIGKNVFGELHPDYAKIFGTLGSLYYQIGDYQKAEEYLLQAQELLKRVSDEQHPAYITVLKHLGNLYCSEGNYKRAESYLLQAQETRTNVLGEQFTAYSSLNDLGYLYLAMGDYSRAETYLLLASERDTSLFEDVGIENDMDYAMSLVGLGRLYGLRGDYPKTETALLQASKIWTNVLGEQHQGLAVIMQYLGIIYGLMNNYQESEIYLQKMYLICRNSYESSLKHMTEKQRQYFLDNQRQYMRSYRYLLFQYQLQKPSVSSNAYDVELFTKGLLLTSSDVVNRSIMESKDSALIADFQELTSLRQRVITLQEKDPQSPYIDQCQHQADSLEKVLTINSAIFRESQAIWNITWDSVRNHLKATDVAIEYMDVTLSGDSTMYCALLLRDTCSYPVMIPLFEEKEVLPLATATTNGEFAPDKVYSDTINGKELTAKIWSKIMPYIKPGETVYFAPSGLLHQLAIEALPYDSTHTMADVYSLVRLSSTREIVMHKNDNHYTTATLYGGIQYDVNADTLLAESRRYAQDQLLASRGIEDDTLDRGNIKYLAWTKTEVEDISDLLQKNKLKVKLYTATSANEESFKALSGKHQNILHIATHGFFWTDSTAQKKDYFTQRMMPFGNDRPAPPSIDPLNRCGLLFAGAQTAWSGHSADLTEGVQDGILTAKEISLLDLRDADLVVLSACETGKGEITSDGVFGLQRAFKQAGAQTIIMSLWPVNDASTQLLMTEFYRNWITNHQSKREAFRNAQNAVRSQYEEPYYWAGFIMLD